MNVVPVKFKVRSELLKVSIVKNAGEDSTATDSESLTTTDTLGISSILM